MTIVVAGALALRPPGTAHVIVMGYLLMSSAIASVIATILLIVVTIVDAHSRWLSGAVAIVSMFIAITSLVILWLG